MYHKFELSSLIRTLFAFPRVPSYTYKPLHGPPDAVRLILLQPAPFLSSPITCRLIETSWLAESTTTTPSRTTSQPHSPKGYTALSYTWGTTPSSNPDLKSITIDGRPFHITPNLHFALTHLRSASPRKELRLWADSLCIDQSSISERNLHVSHMRSIYSHAHSTVIFLGPSTPGSDALLSAILESKSEIEEATTRNAVVKTLTRKSGMRRHELADEASRVLWRGYWKRVWIFQEIVVSENPVVQCGSVRVPWEVFCQAVIALLKEVSVFGGGYGNAAKERLEAVYWERRAWRRMRGLSNGKSRWDMGGLEEEGRMGLLDLLESKRGGEASDARDMVFAISGVASLPVGNRQLNITYEKSPAGVFMDTVKYLLDNTGSWEVLSHAGLHPSQSNPTHPSKHQMPSWAPDWRLPSPYKSKIVDWIASSPTSNRLKRDHVYLPHHDSLICIGYHNKSHLIQSISVDTADIKPAAGTIGRVIWDDKWRRRKLIEHGVLSDLGTKLGSVQSLVSRSHPITYGRKLARLKGDLLALVPREAREGDVVAVFKGAKVPFVLRKLEKEKHDEDDWYDLEVKSLRAFREMDNELHGLTISHYQFIGECFVDGMMRFESQEQHEDEIKAFALH